MSKKWNWYELTEQSREEYRYSAEHMVFGIREENLSWLPIERVPVADILPFNSLEQPALTMFTRIEWNPVYGSEDVVSKFLKEHAEDIGYVIVHKGAVLGIIGVGFSYEHEFHAGFATVFNAHRIDCRDRTPANVDFPKVPVIMTSLTKTLEGVYYSKGERAYSKRINNWPETDDLSDD